MESIMVILTQKLKCGLETSNDSQHSKQKKKVGMLNNALLVQKWISSFDTKNINDCFDGSMNLVPPEILNYEKDNQSTLKIIEKALAQNSNHHNEFSRNQSNT